MRGFVIFFFFFSSCFRALMASLQLQRRILHQPLISPESATPAANRDAPPSPPFFPSDPPEKAPPSTPTNPNSDASSIPVNITSLRRPSDDDSPTSSSHAHLVLLVAAASSVVLVAATVFFYFRRRKLHTRFSHDEKPFRHPPPTSSEQVNGRSSNFIYYMNRDGGGVDGVNSRKVDSPELRPLPQLGRRSFSHAYEKGDDEVFYSPKSAGSGSKSTAASATSAAADNTMSRKTDDDAASCSSFSSSSLHPSSISISPPSRRSSRSKSPDLHQREEKDEEEPAGIQKPSPGNVAPPPAPPLPPVASTEQPPLLIFPPSLPPTSAAPMASARAPSSQIQLKNGEAEGSKPRLKALHWDKVKATSNREMVWDHLKSSSFKVNEEMMESLFVVNSSRSKSEDFARRAGIPCGSQEIRVLDPKKSQNVSILIRALNVTVEEVRDALLEGNPAALGGELLECLLKMAPTKEEERKLKEFNGDVSSRLGPAERFLKAIIDIPFAFRRMEALLYVVNFEHEVDYLIISFKSIQAACEDLRKSRTFLKLLEAVLKTGNRMNVGTNRGGAEAFNLDTLLKLVDVKGVDGKTTLLHFVVKEMVKSEGGEKGMKAVVTSLTAELESVKKAAGMDAEVLRGEVRKLGAGKRMVEEMAELGFVAEGEGECGRFRGAMRGFVKAAEAEIQKVEEEERVAIGVVKETTAYFHGSNMSSDGNHHHHPFRIFILVRDFLSLLDPLCKPKQ